MGIRRRLAPLLERDRRRVELLNSLLLSMPGTPVLYYGDEIGLPTVLDRMRAFEADLGAEFRPAALLERLVAEGRSFRDL